MPLDRHDSNRCTVGADDRDPVASGMADDPAMGQLDVVSVRVTTSAVLRSRTKVFTVLSAVLMIDVEPS